MQRGSRVPCFSPRYPGVAVGFLFLGRFVSCCPLFSPTVHAYFPCFLFSQEMFTSTAERAPRPRLSQLHPLPSRCGPPCVSPHCLPSVRVYLWVQISLFHKDASHIGSGPPFMMYFKLISSVKTLLPSKVRFLRCCCLGFSITF